MENVHPAIDLVPEAQPDELTGPIVSRLIVKPGEHARSDALHEIVKERHKAISSGYTEDHDREYHGSGVLAEAAACFALGQVPEFIKGDARHITGIHGDKLVMSRRQQLVVAGALILAALEILD